MNITLYYCAKTRATRIRWLLEELQIPYQLKNIDIFSGGTPEYLAINPLGQVPSIDIDGEIIIESGAICNTLADRIPEQSLSPPLNTIERAQYEQYMFFAPATLEPPIFQYLLHTSIYPTERRIAEIAKSSIKTYRYVLITLEKMVKKLLKNKDYLIGNKFSCADIMIASVLFWNPEIIAKYPTLRRYSENLKSRDAYQRALQLN